jgi:hypothetical protein
VDAFKTKALLELLHAIEDSPWGEWRGGKPLSGHGLGRLLRDYRIKTMPVYVDGATVRGYKREQFDDAFARYLSVRSVRSVRSKSTSGAGSNASNASNASPTGEAALEAIFGPSANGAPPVPLLGDELYPLLLADAGKAGQITDAEFGEALAHHKLLLRMREGKPELPF